MIELMITIVIIVILSGLALLSFDFIRKEQVASASKKLLSELQQARVAGLTTGPTESSGTMPYLRGVGVRFVSSNAYVVFRFNDSEPTPNGNNYQYDNVAEEISPNTITMPSSIMLQITNPTTNPNNDIVIFDRFGYPKGTDWALKKVTVFVKHKTDAELLKCINVDTNKIREGAWNGTTCVEK